MSTQNLTAVITKTRSAIGIHATGCTHLRAPGLEHVGSTETMPLTEWCAYVKDLCDGSLDDGKENAIADWPVKVSRCVQAEEAPAKPVAYDAATMTLVRQG